MTNQWQSVSGIWNSRNTTSLTLRLYASGASGSAWFDDLTLEPVYTTSPNFETGTGTDASGWVEGTNHTRASDRPHAGSWSIKSTYTGLGMASVSTVIAVLPNTTYRLSGWIYKQATTGNAYLDLGDVAGEPSLHATSTNTWVSVSGLWNSGTYTQVVVRLVTDGGINGAVWFDEVALTPLHKVTSTAYYAAGGQTVAVRRQLSAAPAPSGAGELSYLHTDHLGSSSTTTDASGNVTARQSYYPYGGVRQQVGTLPTRRTYTGQYADDTGLMFYNARYYAPVLGRFISADTIVPGAGSQALNRYMYVLGNPLKYIDPSGHDPCTGISGTYMPDCGVDGWGMKSSGKNASIQPKSLITLLERAEDIRDWVEELGYSAAEFLAIMLYRESYPPNQSWFKGNSDDPGKTFEEAATRWFWTWIQDSEIIEIYGKALTLLDRELMMYNWIVKAMQSEDILTMDLLSTYHATSLTADFLKIANNILQGVNSDWTTGDGMWGWANAYLYEDDGQEYLKKHNLYTIGNGDTQWFIVDAATVRVICQWNKNPVARCDP